MPEKEAVARTPVCRQSGKSERFPLSVSTVVRRCGRPKEMVSDNGREFVYVWEEALTGFGQLPAQRGSNP